MFLDELVPLYLNRVTCALGRMRSFHYLTTYGAKRSGEPGSPLHSDSSASVRALASGVFFNQCNLGQELSALANQKAVEKDGWVCDFIGDDTIFFNCKMLSGAPILSARAAAPWGPNTPSFVEGATTARNGAARQAAICHRGPKLLSATTHFKTKGIFKASHFSKQKNNLFCFGFFCRCFHFFK